MFALQIYTQRGKLQGAADNQQIIPMKGAWNIFDIDNHVVDGEQVYEPTVRVVVHYTAADGTPSSLEVHESDHAYILNSEGKTFRTLYKPSKR